VQTNKTKESVVEFMNELKAIAGARPISETELQTAKLKRVRGYAQQFESVGRIAGEIVTLWSLGLPMTELQNETTGIERTTLAAANAAAARYAAASGATLLLVGDLATIEQGVRDLNLGEIVILDSEGKPVARR
jgi:predicted Zn-dependent peptidase